MGLSMKILVFQNMFLLKNLKFLLAHTQKAMGSDLCCISEREWICSNNYLIQQPDRGQLQIAIAIRLSCHIPACTLFLHF